MSTYPDLLGGPPPTRLPAHAAADAARAGGLRAGEVAARHPDDPAAWADLADAALAGSDPDAVVRGYAFARTGYHRGLDQLRRAGWKGHGPVPWEHEPNRGWLRCVAALARAADRIGEADERMRCAALLDDSDAGLAERLLG